MIWQTADMDLLEGNCDHVPGCQDSYSPEERVKCPRCVLFDEYARAVEREFDEYNASLWGQFNNTLSLLMYRTEPIQRHLKWMIAALLNVRPKKDE